MTLLTRRNLLVTGASFLAAPAIVRASSIMPVRPVMDPLVTVQSCKSTQYFIPRSLADHEIAAGRMIKEIIQGCDMYRELSGINRYARRRELGLE